MALIAKGKKGKWTPEHNCADFSISTWNALAPANRRLNPSKAMEAVNPSMVSDKRVKAALGVMKITTGSYPMEITPRQLGVYIDTLPGHTDESTPR